MQQYCYPTEIFYESEESLNNLQVICPINLGVFNDPVIDEHGHSFCRKCIEECLQSKNKCPYTNKLYSKNNKFIDNLGAKNLIYNLKVKCPNAHCSWRGTIDSLQSHYQNNNCNDGKQQQQNADDLQNNELQKNNDDVNVFCKYKKYGCNFSGSQAQQVQHLQNNMEQHLQMVQMISDEQQIYGMHLEKIFKNQTIKIKQLQQQINQQGNHWIIDWANKHLNIFSWINSISHKIVGPINNISEYIDYQGETIGWGQFIPHGKGIIYYNDQSVYSGNFIYGAKSQKGKLIWIDQSYYYGNFKDDLFHGKGVLCNKSHNWTYDGNFQRGLFHGKGKITYQNGIVEIGEWDNDIKKGYFVTIFPDGKRSVTKYQ